jgi:hypothetical protein
MTSGLWLSVVFIMTIRILLNCSLQAIIDLVCVSVTGLPGLVKSLYPHGLHLWWCITYMHCSMQHLHMHARAARWGCGSTVLRGQCAWSAARAHLHMHARAARQRCCCIHSSTNHECCKAACSKDTLALYVTVTGMHVWVYASMKTRVHSSWVAVCMREN